MRPELSTYELLWPASLFVSEGERILRSGTSDWEDRVRWLLTEALAGTTAVADFDEASSQTGVTDDNPWKSSPDLFDGYKRGPDRREWFTELVNRAAELRYAATPRPYWPQRRGSGLTHDGTAPRDTRRDFARIIGEFVDHGYLVGVFDQECVDRSDDLPDASEVIDRRLGIPGLWPLQSGTWDEDTFYGLIEVFHDLVSRPRRRHFHSFSDCGWHYSEFHHGPARVLYRWKVNRLLREAGIDYELAAEGEDLGRLIAVTDDARSELVHRALNDGPTDTTAGVRHAIALFRGRDASAESKRSAIFNLARILEERRSLIKEHLKKDEGALFEIANRFDLRHRQANQRSEYDQAFLDWIFWWYLGTVELTNQLIAARRSGHGN